MKKPANPRAELMRQAHRGYFAMNWKGPSDWTFSRCLKLAHHAMRAKRDAYIFAQLEEEMRRLLQERQPSVLSERQRSSND